MGIPHYEEEEEEEEEEGGGRERGGGGGRGRNTLRRLRGYSLEMMMAVRCLVFFFFTVQVPCAGGFSFLHLRLPRFRSWRGCPIRYIVTVYCDSAGWSFRVRIPLGVVSALPCGRSVRGPFLPLVAHRMGLEAGLAVWLLNVSVWEWYLPSHAVGALGGPSCP